MADLERTTHQYWRGKHFSEEHREKIRRANLGRTFSEESKKKMSESNKGKHNHSEEVRKKIGKANKDVFRTEEYREKVRERIKKNGHPMQGKKHSIEAHKKMSLSHIGKQAKENNPFWKGGISFLPYSSEFDEKLKRFIKSRDNNECQNPYCGGKSTKLDTHHINYNKQDCSQFNLITLCCSCNGKANANRKEWKRFYKKIIWGKY